MILIIDNNPENLFSLKTLLQRNLYAVETAISGEDALKKILKNEYALIILNVQMPSMDGYEVAEMLTGYSRSKDIPIIFLSAANNDKRFITKGYASGAVDYVTTPFDGGILLLKVKSFCRLHAQTKELKTIQAKLKEEIKIRKDAETALQAANFLLEDKIKERTKKLLLINEELEISNTELQQYASLASHDLQEPLRKIITFSHLVSDKILTDAPKATIYLDKIIVSTGRMRNLINDLLNYSKLSADPQFTYCNLNDLLGETVTDLEVSIGEMRAKLVIGKLPSVEAIRGQMRQVFQNIISNALKFSKKDQIPLINIWGEVIDEKNLMAALKFLEYMFASAYRIMVLDLMKYTGIKYLPFFNGCMA